jgi:hypothetical protein
MIFTDRSRYKTYFFCPFERFLAYHLFGKGVVPTSKDVPLVTGTQAHEAVELILKLVQQTNELPKADEVRYVIEQVTKAYEDEVIEAGFSDLQENERVEFIIKEQTTLVSGLIWAWSSFILPPFLEKFQPLHIEQEMERITGCTCGLAGVGAVATHIERDCQGVVVMTRPDIVALDYATGELVYVELKTGSKIDPGTFDGDVQFAFGAAGIEGFTGKKLSGSYVHALVKGYRKNEYNVESQQYDGPRKQSSPLCYAYVLPANPPLTSQQVEFKYTRKKGYKKTPVWELDFADRAAEVPPLEHYVSLMGDELLSTQVDVFGPYPYPKKQVEETLADIEHLERRNDEVFKYINERVEELGFGHEDVQEDLHEFVPKSWYCRRYGWKVCAYYPICSKQAGWDSPCDRLHFEERTPNHPIEFEV